MSSDVPKNLKIEVKIASFDPASELRHRSSDFGKMTKSQANYQLRRGRSFSEIEDVCDRCQNMIPPRQEENEVGCQIVKGAINRAYYCRYFKKG